MHAFFVIPGDLSLPTGGYAYDRHVLAGARALGARLEHVAIPGGFPRPGKTERDTTTAMLAALSDAPLLIDGLAYGAFSQEMLEAIRQPVIALCHHPLGLETGLTDADKTFFIESEKRALAHARNVIVTSSATARTLATDFAVPLEKIAIAEPGVVRAARATGSIGSGDERLHLLAVGSVIARKGYDLLIEALSRQENRNWRLTIAGETCFQPDTYARLRRQIAAEALERHVTFAGSVDEATLDTLYASADCFLMPSHYEGYGMALTEALARGLPVISSTGGALATTLPDGIGLRFAPGDIEGLSTHLETVLNDAKLRKILADNAWNNVACLPDWQDTTQIILNVLKEHAP